MNICYWNHESVSSTAAAAFIIWQEKKEIERQLGLLPTAVVAS